MDFKIEDHRISMTAPDGDLLAEITFPEVSPGVVNINHTFVDESLRGRGVAGELMAETVRQLRLQGKKAVAGCSYAAEWLRRHPEHADLLATDGGTAGPQ